jgi:D-arginine dehydrogenase
VDASGAWAGRLAYQRSPLSLKPLRRHLFTTGPIGYVDRTWPYVWNASAAFYFRPEGDGLLLSPCDETASEPGLPAVDPEAVLLLERKLSADAPGLGDLTILRQWACLRTFAADRRPVIGPDPVVPGLFHVSGLGGFGMTTSAAVGELAASLIVASPPEWIDAAAVSPARLRVPSGEARPIS